MLKTFLISLGVDVAGLLYLLYLTGDPTGLIFQTHPEHWVAQTAKTLIIMSFSGTIDTVYVLVFVAHLIAISVAISTLLRRL